MLREVKELFGLELPPVGFEKHWLFLLLKAAYGFDDAHPLWRKALTEWLLEHGCQTSVVDGNGQSPLDVAEDSRVASLLRQHSRTRLWEFV